MFSPSDLSVLSGSSDEGGSGAGDGDVVMDDLTSDVDVDDGELWGEQPASASVVATTVMLSATVERERCMVVSFP